MNSNEWLYLNLLERQLVEEIEFLENLGHKRLEILEPCLFCVTAPFGKFKCTRLKTLMDFKTWITSKRSELKAEVVLSRRPIGQPISTWESETCPREKKLTYAPLLPEEKIFPPLLPNSKIYELL